MNDSPLYDSLKSLENHNPLRFDMPGHHGKPLPYFSQSDWTSMDWTEHAITGNLFYGGDVIETAERRWADRWGAEGCLFLTGGTTEGVHIALHLCCNPGDTILIDRGSHRSLWNGLSLLDITPISIPRPWDATKEIAGPMDPAEVEKLWNQHPEAKALFVTSPSFYGITSDLKALADIAHRHGGRLIVDSAHGAHFPWVGLSTPCEQGADVTIISAHKELPVPGQTSLLLYRNFESKNVRYVGSIYGSSSPSYIMMSATDRVRVWLDQSDAYYNLVNNIIPKFKEKLEKTTPFRVIQSDDPARLVLSTKHTGSTGYKILEQLEKEDIYLEMADHSHLVMITSCLDEESDFDRFLNVIRKLYPSEAAELPSLPLPPALPQRVCSLRTAMFSPKEIYPLQDSTGMIAAEDVTPYPPGIPVIAPGERIEKKHLEYLQKIEYNSPITVIKV